MTPSHARGIVAVLLTAIAMAACRSTREAVQTSPQPAAAAQGDLAGIARAQADSARRPYTEADTRFMSGMISHHAQAIVMAGWAPTHGASASVLRLAERIINAQTDEIAIMRQWLRDRRRPVPEAGGAGMKMVMNRGGGSSMRC